MSRGLRSQWTQMHLGEKIVKSFVLKNIVALFYVTFVFI